jgi:phosphocarrier protein HPr
MITKDVTIVNKLGLHARAAAKLVSLAAKFNADIQVAKEGRKVNGKSIMGVMMLAASKNATITLIANGEDEQQAVNEMAQLVLDRFGEEE